jgi:hypothetical protein
MGAQACRELRDVFMELWAALLGVVYRSTLPLTSVLLCRRPGPPRVALHDVRAKRVRRLLHNHLVMLQHVHVLRRS